jgi:hypothetical protein
MLSLPGTLWGCVGSLDMPGYEEMKSVRSSQGAVPFRSLLDLSHLWGSLGRISKIKLPYFLAYEMHPDFFVRNFRKIMMTVF